MLEALLIVLILFLVIGWGVTAFFLFQKKSAEPKPDPKRSELDTLKYEFITVITHKFRTPLTHVKWGAEGLRGAKTETEKELQFRKIERAADTILDMTDVLLKVANAEASGIQLNLQAVAMPIFVREVASEIQEDFAKKKIHYEFDNLSVVPSAMIDKKQIRLVMLTILHNAITYVPEGGQVRIVFREERGYVIVEIIDNGIGISPSELPKIFERFYRGDSARKVDQQGLGVGLYLCKKIVELHKGSINVVSQGEGQGTAVVIGLPSDKLIAAKAASDAKAEEEKKRPADKNTMPIPRKEESIPTKAS